MLVALLALLALLAASTFVASAAQGAPVEGPAQAGKSKALLPDRYIVLLKDSTERPGSVAKRHAENRDALVKHVYRHALNGYAAKIPAAELAAIRKDPNVVSVEPDVPGGVAEQIPPFGVERIFATANEALALNEEDDLRVNADVAVLDSAVQSDHPDLEVVGEVKCYGQPCKEEASTPGGHGTHVAGTIAALDNDIGVVGVAPGSRVWSVAVVSPGGFGNLSEFIAGIDWVTGTREDGDPGNDIEVANASLRYWNEVSSEVFEKAIASSLEAGVVHVAAAGNESETVNYIPGNYPGMITVSALADYNGEAGGGGSSPDCEEHGLDDQLANFSNFGPLVDVAAPGVCIRSTIPDAQYGNAAGTSMASPHVAGAAAILAANDKPESKEDVEAIRDTIVEEGNHNWTDTSGDGVKEPLLDLSDENVISIPPLPWAATAAATDVGGTKATLKAIINPNGFESTYQFEYGTTTEYGSLAPVAPEGIGSETKDLEVSEIVEGLKTNTTYHYRVVAENEHGVLYGKDRQFTTLPAPTVTTNPVTDIMHNAADLNATVHSNGVLPTTYQFECGKTTEYGMKVPASPKDIGFGTLDGKYQEPFKGLEPDTTYHCRVMASNEAGTTYGQDVVFTTRPEWAIESTHNPSATAQLRDISCPTATECVAVGASSTNVPGSQRWDGTEWSALSNFNSGGELTDVHCMGPSSCFALPAEGLDIQELTLSGGKHWWTPVSAPSPAGATSAVLRDVSCVNPLCIAVGTYSLAGGESRTLAEFWDGEKWTLSLPPFEAGGTNALNAVSCSITVSAAASCIAIGVIGGKAAALAWGGFENWYTLPAPKEASNASADLSCFAAEFCTALPGANAKAEHWNWSGGAWTAATLPTPPGGSSPQLHGIDCASKTDCIAVGSYTTASGSRPLAERWNGSAWSALTPLDPEGELHSATFRGVSCRTPNRCAAVGYYEPKAGESKTLAERYDVDPVTEYSLPIPATITLGGVAAGSDGNLWFVGDAIGPADRIGKMTTSGAVTEYSLPSGSKPLEIVPGLGSSGPLWYTNELLDKIGKITTSGAITEYPLPSPAEGGPIGIAVAPFSGDLWFTRSNGKIGKMTPSGAVTEYPLPAGSSPWGITWGPDGKLWFTFKTAGGQGKIGKITTSGAITEYSLGSTSFPRGITTGPDGNLWFAVEGTNKIGKITTSGTITQYSLPSESGPWDIVAGSDGNLWFTTSASGKVGRITTSGTITEHPLSGLSKPKGITTGPDGDLWFANDWWLPSKGSGWIGEISPR